MGGSCERDGGSGVGYTVECDDSGGISTAAIRLVM